MWRWKLICLLLLFFVLGFYQTKAYDVNLLSNYLKVYRNFDLIIISEIKLNLENLEEPFITIKPKQITGYRLDQTRKALFGFKNIENLLNFTNQHPISMIFIQSCFIVEKLSNDSLLTSIQSELNLFNIEEKIFCRNVNSLKNFIKQNKELRAIAFHYAPFTIGLKQKSQPDDPVNGIEVQIVKEIARQLHMNITFRRPTDGGQWGYSIRKRQSHTGLLGDVYRNHGDVGMGQIFIVTSRLDIFDMTNFYDLDGYCFLVKRPPSKLNWSGIVQPFEFRVWIGVFIITIMTGLFMILMRNIESYSNIQAIFFLFSSLSRQSINLNLKTYGMKFYLYLFTFAAVILVAAYSGSLLSFLTIDKIADPADKISDLVDYPGKLASYNKYLIKKLKKETGPVYGKLGEKAVLMTGSIDNELKLAGEGKMSIIDSKTSLEYSIRQRFVNNFGETDMHVMKECWTIHPIGLMLSKNSPLKPFFDKKIPQLMQAGIIKKWISDEMDIVARKGKIKKSLVKKNNPLELKQLDKIFIFQAISLSLAIISFFGELIYGFFTNKSKRSKLNRVIEIQ